MEPLRLYRHLLKLHGRLPAVHRELGLSVVKVEWRQVAAARTAGKLTDVHADEFLREWQSYAGILADGLEGVAAADAAGELQQLRSEALSPEQQARLARLREEAEKLSEGR